MSHNQESGGGKYSAEFFSVGIIGDARWLYGVAEGLLRVDLVKDRRSPMVNLSRISFESHPIFRGELSTLNANRSVLPKFNVRTYLSFAESYLDLDHLGYISDAKVGKIRDEIQSCLPGFCVTGEVIDPNNHIIIGRDEVELRINLGAPSLDARIADWKITEEILKESEHPEGIYHSKYQKFIAKYPLPEQTEEDKEWEQAWREMASDLASEPSPVNDRKNRLVEVGLQPALDSESDEAFMNSLFGVPLTTPEKFKDVLEFYTIGYAALVNAFCKIEGVDSPKQRVLLGSAIFSK